jgi:hypothetical protein
MLFTKEIWCVFRLKQPRVVVQWPVPILVTANAPNQNRQPEEGRCMGSAFFFYLVYAMKETG